MRTPIKVLLSSRELAERAVTDAVVGARFLEMKARKIPIVLWTTGTFKEALTIQNRAGIDGSIIVENGGAIYFRSGCFPATDMPLESRGGHQRISLGLPYAQVVPYLKLIKHLVPGEIMGFSEMTDEDLANRSGLSLEAAKCARSRDYDEPFSIDRNTREVLPRIERTLRGSDLFLSRGQRYFHLTGGTHLGRAIAVLRRLYADSLGPVTFTAVGISQADAAVLEHVDRPVVLTNADGRHLPRFAERLPGNTRIILRKAKDWEDALNILLPIRDPDHGH